MVQREPLGVILAAGKSSRLYPATLATTKQLLPVYDKPLIYYPLSTLMLAGVRNVLFITNKSEQPLFRQLLGDGSELGMVFDYTVQDEPAGIAQALTLTEKSNIFDLKHYNSVFLILGDNLFHGSGLSTTFREALSNCERHHRAQTFFQRVVDPQRFGVGEFDSIGQLVGIEEKPTHPKSNWASVGAYIYPVGGSQDLDGIYRASQLKPSGRGELEITDLNNTYIKDRIMNGHKFPRGTAWFDCGTYDSLLESAQYVQAIQKSQGMMVASPHEIAWYMDNIGNDEIWKYMTKTGGPNKNAYNEYLLNMVERGRDSLI